jgi:hypothetical protein
MGRDGAAKLRAGVVDDPSRKSWKHGCRRRSAASLWASRISWRGRFPSGSSVKGGSGLFE